jgi:O-antigen/teichoic acid export membrane protein
VTVSGILHTLSQQVGNVLLISLSTPEQTGVYGLSLFSSFFFLILTGNVLSYLLPYGARLESQADIGSFLKRTFRITVPMVVGSIALLVLAVGAFPLLFGEAGRSALPVFLVLSCARLIALLYRPLHVVFHYLLKPHLIVIDMSVRIGTILGASLLLVPVFGAMGMALADLIAIVLAGITSIILLRVQQRKNR